jgi:hypothetical protein
MSQENIERLRSAFKAISRADWDAVFEEAEPESRLIPPKAR